MSPVCVSYDAAWAYELAYIVQDGLRRMYGSSPEHPSGEDIFYYLTLYNEPYVQPAAPVDYPGGAAALEQGILSGLYLNAEAPELAPGGNRPPPRASILASGVSCPVGAGRAAAARRGLGRGGGRVVGHLVVAAAARRAGL